MAAVKPEGKTGKPKLRRTRTEVIHFRVTPAWRETVKEAIEFDRACSLAEFFDHAVLSHMEKIGFKKPLPRR